MLYALGTRTGHSAGQDQEISPFSTDFSIIISRSSRTQGLHKSQSISLLKERLCFILLVISSLSLGNSVSSCNSNYLKT